MGIALVLQLLSLATTAAVVAPNGWVQNDMGTLGLLGWIRKV
jgi:hypothetical protein